MSYYNLNNMKKLSLIVLALIATASVALAQDTKEEKKDSVTIYNPKADAQAEINAAVKRAKGAGKNVFIQVGGNWCIWCIRFHDLVNATPELKKYLTDHYEVVLVNYSPENKNTKVLAGLGNPGRFGYPVFLILDGNGKVLHIQNSGYLEEGKGHSVKLITDFLKGWTVDAADPKHTK